MLERQPLTKSQTSAQKLSFNRLPDYHPDFCIIFQYGLSFDTFHTNRDRIYRITNEVSYPEGMNYGMGVPAPLPDAVRLDFPQLEQVAVKAMLKEVKKDKTAFIKSMTKELTSRTGIKIVPWRN
ncbi:MAG: hypothetical protein C0490_14990 [Marivirga sp.]|nr:hypothetical protein [Marivirga sp.]